MHTSIAALSSAFVISAVIGLSAASAGAAPLSTAGLSSTGMSGQSALVQKVHGRHCGYRRGHRHPWACARAPRRYGYGEARDYRRGDQVYEGQYRDSNYSNYPFWANKTFTDADDRGGRGRR